MRVSRLVVLLAIPAWAVALSGCTKRSPTEALDPREGTCESCHVVGVASQVEAGYAVSKDFVTSVHGRRGCTGCHAGTEEPAREQEAHKGLVDDPSGRAGNICASCHRERAERYGRTVHGSQSGVLRAIRERTGATELAGNARDMFEQACGSCHASCGKCHLKRDAGGSAPITAQHTISGEPDPRESCLTCHERLSREYQGLVQGNQPDVHFERGMTCFDCHPRSGFHGEGQPAESRYEVADLPSCSGCHPQVLSETTTNIYHRLMVKKVQCQVCHSQSYLTCYNCHVSRQRSQLALEEVDFRIGKNPAKSDRHPWDWVVLRHVPIAPDSYTDWGVSQTRFSEFPTWRYASPHNIRKKTTQNSGCYGPCHLNAAVFLTRDYLQQKVSQGAMVPAEIEANANVVVEKVP
jgi:hypothetical protein